MSRDKAIDAVSQALARRAGRPDPAAAFRPQAAEVVEAAAPYLVDSARPHGEDCPRRYVGPRTLQIPPCRCDPGDWP